MNKLLLIVFGVLAIAAIVSAWDNEEDSSLSEDLAYSRLVRSAGTRMRKGRKARQGKKARKGRKAQKGKKAGKGKKGRKGRKGKKAKNGKKGRKARKGRKAKKGKKGKKAKKGRKARKGQSGSRSNGRAVSDTCFDTAIGIMKMWKDIIANFDKQSKRMEKQNGTGDSKLGKKGVFESVVHKLLHIGGGNKSAPSCSGATNTSGAAQLKNITDFLSGCQTSVNAACNSTNFVSLINTTKLAECKTVTTAFKTGAGLCMGKSTGAGKTSTDEACTCWTNSTLDATVQAAKKCSFSDEAKKFAQALATCRNAFSVCRKYEDEAATTISACTSDTDGLKRKVAALTQNSAAVKQAQAVVKTLAASRRARRTASAASSCIEVATFAIKLTSLVIDFPSSPNVLVYSATIIASSSVVCSAADKESLTEVDAMFDNAVATLDTAIDAAQEQIETLTGATASPEVIAAEIAELEAEATTTVAASNSTTVAAANSTTVAAANSTTVAAANSTTTATTTTTTTTTTVASGATKVTWTLKTSPISSLPKYTTVFGVPVFASSSTTDAQFQHAASVTAAWLDNDGDGCVDNPTVLAKLIEKRDSKQVAVLIPGADGSMTNTLSESFANAGYYTSALIYTGELKPHCAGPAANNTCWDASLEEIWHIITSVGYANAWPSTFAESSTSNSLLTQAMDVARGGKFTTIPTSYPSTAWYTYFDSTCAYNCMATEYIYWAVNAWVGALVGRGDKIKAEWKFETRAKLVAGDLKITALIKDTSTYKLPNISPNGTYYGPATCSSGTNHS